MIEDGVSLLEPTTDTERIPVIVDDNEAWSEEDMHEATLHSLRHVEISLGEEPQDI